MGFTDDIYKHFIEMPIGTWMPINRVTTVKNKELFMEVLLYFIQNCEGHKYGFDIELNGEKEHPESHTAIRKIDISGLLKSNQ